MGFGVEQILVKMNERRVEEEKMVGLIEHGLRLGFSVWMVLTMASTAVWAADGPPATCSLPIVVRATLLAEGAPQWSTAMIYHQDKKHSQSYTINPDSNQLAPGVFIREIHKLSVIIDNRGKSERCRAEGHRFTGAAGAENRSSINQRFEPTQIDSGQSPNKLRDIFESLADAEKAGPAGIGGASRKGVKAAWTDKFAVPGVAGGPHAPRAFQVGRLQKESIYYQLGIRNFDVIRTVNGIAFESPQKAMDLFEKLGDAGTLTIQVHRRGKNVNIDINVN